ncbi:hypothetical protein BDR04DRAFT_728862 [Suillus decipiens]|nr:hypothetical protein BDR04DRAFT_728862 [Suillus decipiens]
MKIFKYGTWNKWSPSIKCPLNCCAPTRKALQKSRLLNTRNCFDDIQSSSKKNGKNRYLKGSHNVGEHLNSCIIDVAAPLTLPNAGQMRMHP